MGEMMTTPTIQYRQHEDPADVVDELRDALIGAKAPIENDGSGHLFEVNGEEAHPILTTGHMAGIVWRAGIRFVNERDEQITPPKRLMKALIDQALVDRWFLTASSPWTTIQVARPEAAVEALRDALIELKAPIFVTNLSRDRKFLIWRDNATEAMRLLRPPQLGWRAENLGIRFVDEHGKEARGSTVTKVLRTFIRLALEQQWFRPWERMPKEGLYG